MTESEFWKANSGKRILVRMSKPNFALQISSRFTDAKNIDLTQNATTQQQSGSHELLRCQKGATTLSKLDTFRSDFS